MAKRPNGYTTIEGLKRLAKQLKRDAATPITHAMALERAARAGGYDGFAHARETLA